MNDIDSTPVPHGDLALQTVAMPKDTNPNGDIFGGWLMSQMDIAGMVTAAEVAGGRVAT
ncbi:MAG: acyl-CoA thioesterase, partial [Halieaceae bacterium]|nr:acyl-CoA thioesterase [Halieaceae bacterium]